MGIPNSRNNVERHGTESERKIQVTLPPRRRCESVDKTEVSASEIENLATILERLEKRKAAVSHLMDQVLDHFARPQLRERMLTVDDAAYYCGFRSSDSQHRRFKRFAKQAGIKAKTDKKTGIKAYDIVDLNRALTTGRVVLEQ